MLPLTHLLAHGRPGRTPVAAHGDAVLDWATFVGHVGALRASIVAKHDSRPTASERWAVFTEDAWAFAVTLMGVWQAGCVAVIIPNVQPGTLSRVAPTLGGIVTDEGTEMGGIDGIGALQLRSSDFWTPVAPHRDTPAIELFTSGTTGDRRTVVKTFGHLEDEIDGLERSWGAILRNRQAIGTVSHQHIYGLLFRVLWPLCASRVFRAEALVYPEEMLSRLRGSPGYLVSAPPHLTRLADMLGAPALGEVCRPFFSSGGPVSASTATRLREMVGFAPVEIFGSTETGGVAWRQQTGAAASLAWTPFDDVFVRANASGLLHVSSPRVCSPGSFTLADRVDMLDGGFLVHGRADRDVKVAGKRVSLAEMEEHLLRHRWVAEAALVLDECRGEPRVAAAIVLTVEGEVRLAEVGRRSVSADLTAHLATCWDRVLLPRAYRYVASVPEDAQGKRSSALIRKLFVSPAANEAFRPEILAEDIDGTTCRRRLRVPGPGAFEGHFPDSVVVPGFVQIEWVMDAAAHLAGHAVTSARLEGVKFKSLLHPDEIVELRTEFADSPAGVTFQIARADGRVISQGRCWLADEVA
jgi:acyl-coenzyme A synthetase/AMP-(fatty) acid ligase